MRSSLFLRIWNRTVCIAVKDAPIVMIGKEQITVKIFSQRRFTKTLKKPINLLSIPKILFICFLPFPTFRMIQLQHNLQNTKNQSGKALFLYILNQTSSTYNTDIISHYCTLHVRNKCFFFTKAAFLNICCNLVCQLATLIAHTSGKQFSYDYWIPLPPST